MSATGELQSLAPRLDFLELAELLRRRVAGEPFPYSFIHEVSAYSAAPEDLVRGRDPAPGTDGKDVWYFCSAPNFHQSAGGAPKRNRQVGGGQERRFWHPEGGKIPIRGPDRKPVGAYWRTLSYVLKVKNPPAAAKSFRNERLGWCMLEVGLQQQDGDQFAGQQWEICKVYRSPLPPSSSTAAAGEDVYAAPRTGASGVEDSANRRGMSGGDNTCPTPPPASSSRDNQSILLTTSTNIVLKSNITMMEIENTSKLGHNFFIKKTLSIFKELGIPVDCITTSEGEGKMSFALVPSELLTGKLIKLAIDHAVEELQKYAGVNRLEGRSVIYLTGNAQMSSFILGKALSVLRSINVTVQKSLQDPSKVALVSLVVSDSVAEECVQALRSEFHEKRFIPEVHGAEKECAIPSNSSRAVSSSSLKRKVLCLQAARGVRPERAEITGPSGSSVVVQTGNDPIPAMATGALEDEEYLSWMRRGHQFPVGMRVLAVDDDPVCLKVLETLLRRCQYHVTATNQAVIALRMLRENRDMFDLVISDVHMPDMDGFKLLELVGLEMDLPVIMLCVNGETKTVLKGITHGACDYLLKPVRIEELRNIWQHVVRRKFSTRDSLDLDTYEECNKPPSADSDYLYSQVTCGSPDQSGRPSKKRKEYHSEEEDEDGDGSGQDNDDFLNLDTIEEYLSWCNTPMY